MKPLTTKDRDFKKFKEDYQEDVRRAYAIPEERTLTLCIHCGRISYGWGYRCRYCMKDTRVDLSEAYYEIKDYEGGNED